MQDDELVKSMFECIMNKGLKEFMKHVDSAVTRYDHVVANDDEVRAEVDTEYVDAVMVALDDLTSTH